MNKGIIYIILSGICFIIVNFFVKVLGSETPVLFFPPTQSYPGHELVLARSVVSFVLSAAIIKQRGLHFWGNNKKWLLIRGISGTIALTIFFYTLHYLPLAVASTIQYLSPIFTVIFAIFLLKERVKLLQWFFIGLSFIGVSLIAISDVIAESDLGLSYFWVGMGMISAVGSGIAYTAIRKLRSTDAPIVIVMYFPMIAIPIMTILCFYEFTIPQGIEWLYLLIIGLFTQFAQILLTKALHEGEASIIMPFQYLGAIYAFLLGYFVFDEKLHWMIDLGIILVISSVVINVILRNRK